MTDDTARAAGRLNDYLSTLPSGTGKTQALIDLNVILSARPSGLLREAAIDALDWWACRCSWSAHLHKKITDWTGYFLTSGAETILAALDATEPGLGDGVTTDCPQEGVHNHPFRGPHRFTEWYAARLRENRGNRP